MKTNHIFELIVSTKYIQIKMKNVSMHQIGNNQVVFLIMIIIFYKELSSLFNTDVSHVIWCPFVAKNLKAQEEKKAIPYDARAYVQYQLGVLMIPETCFHP